MSAQQTFIIFPVSHGNYNDPASPNERMTSAVTRPNMASVSPPPSRTRRHLVSALGFLVFLCGMAGMIGLATYGGMRAGEGERSVRSTATANAYLLTLFQRGLDELNRGNPVLAQAYLEEAYRIQPGNAGVRDLILTAQFAQTPTPTPVPPTPTPIITDKGDLLGRMQTAYAEQDWNTVINLGDQLRALDSAYQEAAVNDLRYKALVARGLARIAGNEIEAGLYDLDIAATIHPLDSATEGTRQIASLYQDAITYVGADWSRAIKLLKQVYTLSPSFRDVASRLFEAYLGAGDAYAAIQDWCPAEQQYAGALSVRNSPSIEAKRANAQQRCLLATPVVVTGGVLQGVPGMTGRLAYAAFDPNQDFYTLYLYDSGAGQVNPIEAGGMQPSFQRASGALVYTVGSAVRAYYSGEGAGSLYNGPAAWPSLSPDAGRIAFAVFENGAWGIYIAPTNGASGPVFLTHGTHPAWGPTGLIVYQDCPDGLCGLYVINPDNPIDRRRLTTSAGDLSPSWSPDGNEIVYVTNFTGAWELYTVSMAGQFRQLTSMGGEKSGPAFSPNGAQIAFASNHEGSWAIYIINADGGNLRKLGSLSASHPYWQNERLAWGP